MKLFIVFLFPFAVLWCGPAPAQAQKPLPETQKEAIAAIEKLGGRVERDDTTGEVTRVSVFGGTADAVLAHLKELTSLTASASNARKSRMPDLNT